MPRLARPWPYWGEHSDLPFSNRVHDTSGISRVSRRRGQGSGVSDSSARVQERRVSSYWRDSRVGNILSFSPASSPPNRRSTFISTPGGILASEVPGCLCGVEFRRLCIYYPFDLTESTLDCSATGGSGTIDHSSLYIALFIVRLGFLWADTGQWVG